MEIEYLQKPTSCLWEIHKGFNTNARHLQVMGNKKHRLVGAPRFELGTSCAQGRRNISWKSFLFNLSFENKRVRKIFGSGTMYRNVAPHALSPPNFPHSERTAKVLRSVPAS